MFTGILRKNKFIYFSILHITQILKKQKSIFHSVYILVYLSFNIYYTKLVYEIRIKINCEIIAASKNDLMRLERRYDIIFEFSVSFAGRDRFILTFLNQMPVVSWK